MFPWFPLHRPDPFKFWPPHVDHPWIGCIHWINRRILEYKFRVPRLYLEKQSHQALQNEVQKKAPLLILLNHVNFIDPHIAFYLSTIAQETFHFMAGIEPFEKWVNTVLIQNGGTFSIDRGLLDKRGMGYAQKTLDEGRYPLLMFPEGEACFNNGSLNTFLPGACLFALQTALNQELNHKSVTILPGSVYYRFKEDANPQLRTAIARLAQDIQNDLSTLSQEAVLNTSIDGSAPLAAQMKALMHLALGYLELKNLGHVVSEPLKDRLFKLQRYYLEQLTQRHLPDQAIPDAQAYEAIMQHKNKIRSLVARKRYAPEAKLLQKRFKVFDQLKDLHLSASPKLVHWVSRVEVLWLGLDYTHDPLPKRLHRLKTHLELQRQYTQLKAQHGKTQWCLWEEDMTNTRRVKMLTLLQDELERTEDSCERWDEYLTKLELLVFERFVYRGPKLAYLKFAAPRDVRQWLTQQSEGLSKRELAAQLTEEMKAAIQHMLDELKMSTAKS